MTFPDYPRDEEDFIPEPLCYDALRIWPELGCGGLWDMNGYPISLSFLTQQKGEHPLDLAFERWQEHYDGKPVDADFFPIWDSEEEQIEFDAEGKRLAREVYEFFGRTKTIFYFPRRSERLRWDAEGKPLIRLDYDDPIEDD